MKVCVQCPLGADPPLKATEIEPYPLFNGRMDVDITPRGVKHMERAAEFIAEAGVRKIYSSNLKRTVRGAKIISNQIGFNESREVVPEIKEIHLGEWQGLTGEEIDSLYPGMREERYANIEHLFIFQNTLFQSMCN